MNKKIRAIKRRELKQHKFDRRVYRSLPYVEVIEGKFYYRNAHGKVVMKNKPYNWRVDRNTRHIKDAKIGRVASVYNRSKFAKYHKSYIIITNIIHAKGKIARKMALQLTYVINFYNEHLDKKADKIVSER